MVTKARNRSRRRHTPTMKLLQMQYRMNIDRLILNELQKSQGEFRAVAKKLKVSAATLSRWIVELGLIVEAAAIRRSFDLVETITELSLEPEVSGSILHLSGKVVDVCTACKKDFDEIDEPEFLGVSEEIGVNSHSMVIRDSSHARHWFPLDDSSIQAGEIASTEAALDQANQA